MVLVLEGYINMQFSLCLIKLPSSLPIQHASIVCTFDALWFGLTRHVHSSPLLCIIILSLTLTPGFAHLIDVREIPARAPTAKTVRLSMVLASF